MHSGLDGRLLATQFATRFVFTSSGPLSSENDPDRTPTPRLYLAGCRQGNVVRLRYDVDEGAAQAIEPLAEDEPDLCEPGSLPVHLSDYVRLLDSQAPVTRWDAGLIWSFPDQLNYQLTATLVSSATPAGDRLLSDIVERGMPEPLRALGFRGAGDFRAPWCVALHEGEIASIAFSARIGLAGAEVGVLTLPGWHGHGYAAEVTAGWPQRLC